MSVNMVENNDILNKYLIINLGTSKFTIRIRDIAEVIHCKELTYMPSTNSAYKGVMNRRDEVISVMDLRVMLGMESIEQEANDLISMLKEREQDHKDWVDELIASVIDKREFKLTKDPHLCEFGKWYDNFKSESYIVNHHLDRFATPHKKIHEKAAEIEAIIVEKGYESAEKIAYQAKERELKVLLNLFEELYQVLQNTFTELVVIFKIRGKYQALTVDSVDRIITFEESAIERNTHFAQSEIIEGTILFENKTIPLINESKIFIAIDREEELAN